MNSVASWFAVSAPAALVIVPTTSESGVAGAVAVTAIDVSEKMIVPVLSTRVVGSSWLLAESTTENGPAPAGSDSAAPSSTASR
jgi:hypothetical protein